MRSASKLWTTLWLAAVLAAFGVSQASLAAAPAPPSNAPVVVELFTSQGCSSCPPADALLGELAQREGVLALSFHVDYWNYIGWKDPFSSPSMTARQRAYMPALGQRYVYTPQMVIDGRYQEVGSDETAIKRIVERLTGAGSRKLGISLVAEGGNRGTVRISARPYSGEAAVWLIAYDDKHITKIGRGENAGRTLSYFHVVRGIRRIGTWRGEAEEIPLDLTAEMRAGFENCAVIVQEGVAGPIIGAASIRLAAPK
ncbi:MAG: DUF1223 domain-containing protein [Proteobacteria bacterium]|nr:DUF1223 domain-containing protein [Pseudomonadota bacterium]